MISPPELEASLWVTTAQTALSAGFGITPSCTLHLRGFISTGVARLVAEGRLEDNQGINETRSNLVRFVEQMIVEAKALGLVELHEPTFFSTLPRLCPLWPFC